MGRLKAALLGGLALATLGLSVPTQARASNTPTVTTSTTADGRTTTTVTTVTVQRETEKDRYRRLKGRKAYRLLYPAVHRSPGDRAHKRWKRCRRGCSNG